MRLTLALAATEPIPLEAAAATVRWESALPIVDARQSVIPEEFAGRYVISVTGPGRFGPIQTRVPDVILKNSATLSAKGKQPAQPGLVEYTKSGATVLFGFEKDFLNLTAADKDVQFFLDSGDLELKARFEPKEMMYHGQLAL